MGGGCVALHPCRTHPTCVFILTLNVNPNPRVCTSADAFRQDPPTTFCEILCCHEFTPEKKYDLAMPFKGEDGIVKYDNPWKSVSSKNVILASLWFGGYGSGYYLGRQSRVSKLFQTHYELDECCKKWLCCKIGFLI